MDTVDKASSLSRHQLSTHQIGKPQPTHLQGSLTSKKCRAAGAHSVARGEETCLGMVRRVQRINRTLAVAYPNIYCELNFRSPYGFAVATILSAQCTDVRVNMTTPTLFARYPDPADLAVANQEEVEELARPTGFYRNKAADIIGFAQRAMGQYGDEVPGTLDELMKLSGVGRKIVSVVLGNAFGVLGSTVDTRFGRLVWHMGLIKQEDLMHVEYGMTEVLPHAGWTWFSHRLIFHSRRVCHSHRAACGARSLVMDYPPYGIAGPAEPETTEKLIKPDDREWLLYPAGPNDGYSGEEFSAPDDGDSAHNTTATQGQSRSTPHE